MSIDSLRRSIVSCRRSIDDFLGVLDNSANRVRRLFSKSVHSHSIDVGNKVEVEYMLYHQLDKKVRDYVVDEVLKITKELGCPFKIVLGEFLGNNDVHDKALLFEDVKYNPKDFDKDYFYIQISYNSNEDSYLLREIKREIMKAALLYIDYLYNDEQETITNLIFSNIAPLFKDDVNNASYVYKDRDFVRKIVMDSGLSKRAGASYSLIKINIEKLTCKEVLDDYELTEEMIKEMKILFLELFSLLRNTTDLYKEWMNDINRIIFRKQISLMGENKNK